MEYHLPKVEGCFKTLKHNIEKNAYGSEEPNPFINFVGKQ